jgi:fimbrial chaperone protein
MRVVVLLAGLALAALGGAQATAASLRVSPVSLDLPAGQNATTLTLQNDDAAPLNVQIRVFRWTQANGRDVLTPAAGVVASPPIAKVEPGASRTVRVVRLDGRPPQGEEAYRLIVDELPPPLSETGRQVTLLMRHSIPLFFGSARERPRVEWRLQPSEDGGSALVGRNNGARRLRLANLRIGDASGAVLAERKGLVGYVLPGAEVSWPAGAFQPAAGVRLIADTDTGPIDAPLKSD